GVQIEVIGTPAANPDDADVDLIVCAPNAGGGGCRDGAEKEPAGFRIGHSRNSFCGDYIRRRHLQCFKIWGRGGLLGDRAAGISIEEGRGRAPALAGGSACPTLGSISPLSEPETDRG